jgi:hypothetical protein
MIQHRQHRVSSSSRASLPRLSAEISQLLYVSPKIMDQKTPSDNALRIRVGRTRLQAESPNPSPCCPQINDRGTSPKYVLASNELYDIITTHIPVPNLVPVFPGPGIRKQQIPIWTITILMSAFYQPAVYNIVPHVS